MQEVIDLLTEDPERAKAMTYMAPAAVSMAYVSHKNDFGASGMTNNELNDYLEENSGLTINPVTSYKKHVYSNELDERKERNETL